MCVRLSSACGMEAAAAARGYGAFVAAKDDALGAIDVGRMIWERLDNRDCCCGAAHVQNPHH